MPKRLYITDIIGDGTAGNRYRPALDAVGVPYLCVIKSNVDGSPARSWTLAVAGGDQHAAIRALPGVDALPVVPLDTKLSELTAQQRQGLRDMLQRRGLPPAEFADAVQDLRQLVRKLGLQHEDRFDDARFDLPGEA